MIPKPPPANLDLSALHIGVIGSGNIFDALKIILGYIFLWAGIIAFFYVLWGGFMYLTAGGDPGKTAQGQKTITNAIIGVIILFVSYALVRYVTSIH